MEQDDACSASNESCVSIMVAETKFETQLCSMCHHDKPICEYMKKVRSQACCKACLKSVRAEFNSGVPRPCAMCSQDLSAGVAFKQWINNPAKTRCDRRMQTLQLCHIDKVRSEYTKEQWTLSRCKGWMLEIWQRYNCGQETLTCRGCRVEHIYTTFGFYQWTQIDGQSMCKVCCKAFKSFMSKEPRSCSTHDGTFLSSDHKFARWQDMLTHPKCKPRAKGQNDEVHSD